MEIPFIKEGGKKDGEMKNVTSGRREKMGGVRHDKCDIYLPYPSVNKRREMMNSVPDVNIENTPSTTHTHAHTLHPPTGTTFVPES